MSLEHMFMECKASDAIVRAQNRLWNFHVRTRKKNANSARVCALSEEDDGEERLRCCNEKITWQKMLVPVGMEHRGTLWHARNNELIFELRREMIRMHKQRRKPPPEPPPPSGGGHRRRGMMNREPTITERWTEHKENAEALAAKAHGGEKRRQSELDGITDTAKRKRQTRHMTA